MYPDIPLFELASLADRFSSILDLDVRMYVREVSGKPLLLPSGKKQNSNVWAMGRAWHTEASFCLGFTSALY